LTSRELGPFLLRRIRRDPLARTLEELARSTEVPTWLVGGYVRDAALRRPAKDLDLTAGPAAGRLIQAIQARIGHRGFRFRKRGVTTWRFSAAGRQIDVVDAGRRGLVADLRRRELTINAIAFDLISGRVADPVRGLSDLRHCRLRLPRPGVIQDDPVRSLRIARFLAELPKFTLAGRTRSEAREVGPALRRAAVERVRIELDKLLTATAPQRGLAALGELAISAPLLPELEPMRACQAGNDRPDVWTHTVAAIEISARPARLPGASVIKDPAGRLRLRWALLLHDIAKPETLAHAADGRPSFHGHEVVGARRAEALLSRLRTPRAERRRICRLILNHLRPGHLADCGASPRGLRRLVHDSCDDVPSLALHASCDAKASGGPDDPARWGRLRDVLGQLLEIAERRSRVPLPRLIDGTDLMREFGLEAGPRIGSILRRIRDAQEEGRISSRVDALELAEALARDDG
jgi:poly(A) polymerase